MFFRILNNLALKLFVDFWNDIQQYSYTCYIALLPAQYLSLTHAKMLQFQNECMVGEWYLSSLTLTQDGKTRKEN